MIVRRQGALLGLALAVSILASSARVRTDDPVSSSVRFTGEIVRIFDRKCQPCHAANGLAMPLSNYRDVRAWGRAIREEIVEQRMPPWTAARGYGRFRNDLSLSARETITVLSWIDGGMPRGEDRDLPPAPHAAPAAAADLRIELPAQRVPARQDHVVRRVAIDLPAAQEPRGIARITLAPGAPQTLRGALIYAANGDEPRGWIGAWLPWQHDAAAADGHAFSVDAAGRVIVELHYRGADADVTDTSALEISYAAAGTKPIDEIAVEGKAPARLTRDASVWAIVPSPGSAAASLQLTATRPDGSSDVLLWIPQVHRDWPQALILDAPVAMPAGTVVSLVAHPSDPAARARLSLLR